MTQSQLETGVRPDGILLYPAAIESKTFEYCIGGMQIRIGSVNFGQPWGAELLRLIEETSNHGIRCQPNKE